MSIQKINIHEAKTKLSAVLMKIEKTGESVVICRNGKPVAELSPFKPRGDSQRPKVHPVMGQMSSTPIQRCVFAPQACRLSIKTPVTG